MLPRTQLADYRLLFSRGESSGRPSQWLIRPLLEVDRAAIEAYCEQHGLQPRFDRSNLDTTYFRNWLRQQVFPLLAKQNPKVRQVLRRSARVIADDQALLRAVLDEAWLRVVLEDSSREPDRAESSGQPRAGGGLVALDLSAWRALHPSLQRSMMREAIHRLRWSLRDISFLHVENALAVARDGTTGDRATLPGGLVLGVAYDRLIIGDATAIGPVPDWPLLRTEAQQLELALPGDTPLPGCDWVLRAVILDRAALPEGWAASAGPWQAFFDARLCGRPLVLRRRRPGDRFQPQGLNGHSVKVADFYTNRKVPSHLRGQLPLLADPERILWVCGWRLDERVLVGELTKEVLALSFVRTAPTAE